MHLNFEEYPRHHNPEITSDEAEDSLQGYYLFESFTGQMWFVKV